MTYRQITTEISYRELIDSPRLWIRYSLGMSQALKEMEKMVKESGGVIKERFTYDNVLNKTKVLGVRY